MKVEIKTKPLKCLEVLDLPAGVVEQIVGILATGKGNPTKVEFDTKIKGNKDSTKFTTRVSVKKITVKIQTTFKVDSKIFKKKGKTGSIFLCRTGGDDLSLGGLEFSLKEIPGKDCCRFGFEELIDHVTLHAIDAEGALTAILKGLEKQKIEKVIKLSAKKIGTLDREIAKAKIELTEKVRDIVQIAANLALTNASFDLNEQSLRSSQFTQLKQKKRKKAILETGKKIEVVKESGKPLEKVTELPGPKGKGAGKLPKKQ